MPSKPFFTRSSSIADDQTTLCPTIPPSFSIDWSKSIELPSEIDISLDDESSPSRFSKGYTDDANTSFVFDLSTMSGGMEEAVKDSNEEYTTPKPSPKKTMPSTNSSKKSMQSKSNVDNATSATNASASMDMATLFQQFQQSMQTTLQTMRHDMEEANKKLFLDAKEEQQRSMEVQKSEIEALKTQLKNQSAAKPPVTQVQVPVSTTTESKKSYASASKNSKDDETVASSKATGSATGINNTSSFQQRQTQKQYNVTTANVSIPKGTHHVPVPLEDNTILCIKAFSFSKKINKVKSDDDEAVNFQTVANGFIQAAKVVDPQVDVIVKSVIELTPQDNDFLEADTKVHAQLVVKLKPSCYTITNIAQVVRLKNIAQEIIYKEAHHNLDGFPSYLNAFQFEINDVNYPHQMVCTGISGLGSGTICAVTRS